MSFLEGVVQWTFNAQRFNNVLHYDTGAQGLPDFVGLTDYFWDVFNTHGLPGIVNDCVFDRMSWREDIPGGVGTVRTPTNGTLAGTAGASETVAQVAMIIRKVGQGSVRPHQGRIYQPGIASSAFTAAGFIDGTAGNALESMWEDLLEIEDGNGVTAVMVIKASNPTAPNTVAYNLVDSLVGLGNPGTQRRRRIGVGS